MTLLETSVQRLRRAARILWGREVWPDELVSCQRINVGNKRASWCLCPLGLSRDSIVYSFGIGDDVSFDLAMIERFGLQVHAFDPTPKSLQWIRKQHTPDRLIVHEYGLAGYDGDCQFFPSDNPSYVSHSAIERRGTTPITAPVRRLGGIMKTLGHSNVNLLKMDIEGAEYDVIRDIVASRLMVDQLLVEFHHRWPSIGVKQTRAAVRCLRLAGYHIFNVSANGEEYSFIRS